MPWEELSITLTRREAPRVGEALFALGAAGLQEDFLPGEAPPLRQPWDTGPLAALPARVVLRAFFEDPDRGAVRAGLSGLISGEPSWSPVPDTDWEAVFQASFPPLHISDRLVVAPPWDAPPGALIIEPGQGFGTGSHETTRAALVALDALADEVSTVLDVGCGSGILALAAVKLGLSAEGIDVDPQAVADARAQAARNGMDVRFSTASLASLPGTWDLVLANLYAEVLRDLSDDLVRVTGRHLVLAGILAAREPQVRAAFDGRLRLTERVVDGEWVSLRYRR